MIKYALYDVSSQKVVDIRRVIRREKNIRSRLQCLLKRRHDRHCKGEKRSIDPSRLKKMGRKCATWLSSNKSRVPQFSGICGRAGKRMLRYTKASINDSAV